MNEGARLIGGKGEVLGDGEVGMGAKPKSNIG